MPFFFTHLRGAGIVDGHQVTRTEASGNGHGLYTPYYIMQCKVAGRTKSTSDFEGKIKQDRKKEYV